MLVESRRLVETTASPRQRRVLARIAHRRSTPDDATGVIATLVPETSNRREPYAVVVRVDGRSVGHLPAQLAATVQAQLVEFENRTRSRVAVRGRIVTRCEAEGTFGVQVFFDVADLRRQAAPFRPPQG